MVINKEIKKVWKILMRPLLKIYSGNLHLFIVNDPRFLPEKKHYSQFGQDIYVFENIFKEKENGVFVDIGGNHPVNDNNTYLLEEKGWTGVAFEPQEFLSKLWPENRKTNCLPYVIGENEEDVIFVEGDDSEHGLSGVDLFNKCSHSSKKIKVKQKKLSTVLGSLKIKTIDYLSIDVEGYEINVLKGIDFSECNIELIGVENDKGLDFIPFFGKKLSSEFGGIKIRRYLRKKGYKHIARIFCDDFFIKNNKYK